MKLAGPAKLIGVVCLLLWVFSAAAAESALRPEPDSNSAFLSQTASNESGEARQTEIRELKQGQVIERELAGGEAHTYRVAVASGQYLKAVVEQKGIDVVVRLFGTDSQKMAEVDNNPAVGMESVAAVAEASGNY